jgi:hypothetical protein
MIPSFQLVEDIPDWGLLVRLVGGEHHGATVLLVPTARTLPAVTSRRGDDPPGRRFVRLANGHVLTAEEVQRTDAKGRAEALLESLLDERQRADWRSRREFSVETPFGAVDLGRMSNLGFTGRDGRRLVLCVVPARPYELPEADVWTNLLLVLRGEPRRFFDVANYWTPRGRRWQRGPVPLPPGDGCQTALTTGG